MAFAHTIRKTAVVGRYEVVDHDNISISRRGWSTASHILGEWFVNVTARSALGTTTEQRFACLRDAREFVDGIINPGVIRAKDGK